MPKLSIGDSVRIYSKLNLGNIGVVIEYHPSSKDTGLDFDIYTVETSDDTDYYFKEELELI